MASRGKWALVALTCLAAVLAAATFAQAAQQFPKNGCASDGAYVGSLTSPPFTPISADESTDPTVTVQGWFEIESVSPTGRDEIIFEYFSPNDPEPGFHEFGRMNPTTASGGQQDLPYSNNGLSATPSFQQFNLALPVGVTRNVANVQVRVRFDSGDGLFQGFRGAGVDNITLQATPTNLTTDFENGLAPWTADGAGPGEPFWQPMNDSQDVSVSPAVNPPLVTLPDSGALPETPHGQQYAWFGNVASGTFCGPDFANLAPAPDTTITSAPPASSPSNDATFEFTTTDTTAGFECRLDGGGFTFCFSPQTYSGLADGTHTFEVRATGFNGTDPTPATHTWTIRPAELSDLDNPTYGVDVNVDQVAGVVKVAVPSAAARAAASGRASQKGLTFVPLSEARQVPVGSFLDTRKGTVRLESAANSAGKRQRGTFLNSLFQIRQSRKRSARGLTDLILKGSSFRRCRTGRGASNAVASLTRAQIRRLRANANGRFRTRGRNSSATVRGTIWDTIDRCDGTLTKVKRGKVVVRDFRRKKNITLTAGKSYLAKAPR